MLWKKLTLWVLIVTIAILGLATCIPALYQTSALRTADEERASAILELCCRNTVVGHRWESADITRELTQRAVAAYTFSQSASFLHDEFSRFSLVHNGEYLYNTSPCDPLIAFSSVHESNLHRMRVNSTSYLLVQYPYQQFNQTFHAYLTLDVTQTEQRILNLWCISLSALILSSLLCTLLVALLVRRRLKPITQLTQTAASIAAGTYSLRTQYRANDEIGQLSLAFDSMAQSVEDTIRQLREELDKRQLLIGAMAHELRTPMAAVVGYADSLLHMPLSEDQKKQSLKHILRAGQRAEGLARKMLELTSLSEEKSIEPQLLDAELWIESLRMQFPDRVDFIVHTHQLWGDEALLHSLAVNLITNALRASAENDRVTVTLQERLNQTLLIVSDHGCGIQSEHIPLLTEPFYRVDKARSRQAGGAGLGLTLCYLILQRHGGYLSIESTPGEGSVFTACWPFHTTR